MFAQIKSGKTLRAWVITKEKGRAIGVFGKWRCHRCQLYSIFIYGACSPATMS